MKLYLMTAMVLAGLCTMSEAAPKSKKNQGNLGNVVYIGDSITHGFGAPSYRWALHKIFVDNGIEYNEIGVEEKSHSGGVEPGTSYIGRQFANTHAAYSGQRAYETSGRDHEKSPRLDKTDIFDWLEIEGKADSDKRRLGAVPDTAVILLGTNDLLSDHKSISKSITTVQKALLNKKNGDMCVIVNALLTKNKNTRVYVLAVPAWGETASGNTQPKDYEVVLKGYNSKLRKTFKKEFVDINEYMIDVANEEKMQGVADFLNARDKLHPTLQGDLLIAGQVARAMGIAGRSAGLPRKAASAFDMGAQAVLAAAATKEGVASAGKGLTIAPGKKLEMLWTEEDNKERPFAVELRVAPGDGAKDGWRKEPLVQLTLGRCGCYGQLGVSESYIMWGKKVLCAYNMSKLTEPIRVAWVPGSESLGVQRGFYVWLGDMLIGEGLPDADEKVPGVRLENLSDKEISIADLAVDKAASAPTTKLLVKKAAEVVQDAN